MKNESVYLTYLQVMIILHRLDEMHKDNQYFNDEISNSFKRYVLERSKEMALMPEFKLKILPGANKYVVSASMFNYLVRLTGIDPFEKSVQKEYKPLIEEVEQEARRKMANRPSESEKHK